MTEFGVGDLASALAKAQGDFPAVKRDKSVTVTTKTGKQYTFSYAPLDSILSAVRGPLAANGLVIVQVIDDGALETALIHESGQRIGGRIGLPDTTDIQAFGSAVTYLRRYAIQAMLGIAAEDDDDGNRAAGNTVAAASKPAPLRQTDDDGLIGTAEVGKSDADFELRQTPDGMALAFRLVSAHGGIKVIATDPLASALAAYREETIGQRVICWGHITDETFTPKNAKRPVTYQVLRLERIQAPAFTLPGPAEAETVPLFSEDEQAAIAAAVDEA